MKMTPVILFQKKDYSGGCFWLNDTIMENNTPELFLKPLRKEMT